MTPIELWMLWTSISECEVPPIEIAADIARTPHAYLALRHDGAIGGGYWGGGVEQYAIRVGGTYVPLNPSITRTFKRRVLNGWHSGPSPELLRWAKS